MDIARSRNAILCNRITKEKNDDSIGNQQQIQLTSFKYSMDNYRLFHLILMDIDKSFFFNSFQASFSLKGYFFKFSFKIEQEKCLITFMWSGNNYRGYIHEQHIFQKDTSRYRSLSCLLIFEPARKVFQIKLALSFIEEKIKTKNWILYRTNEIMCFIN